MKTRRSFRFALLLTTAAMLAGGASAQDSLRAAIKADYKANLADLFVHFHQNPELSHREFKTAERLAAELEALGYRVTTGVGGTGVVATMENGDGPTVMLRADMDGLPVEERSGLPYASKARQVDINGVEQPVMHACGHDVHVTALVGAARQLAARRDEWSGTLVLIGQPAEERISGARDMLADGLYERFPKPDYALAFHVAAGKPAGRIEVPQGIAYSSSDSVDIIVRGVGAHGASPHQGVDPVLIAAQIVVSLQTLVSRTIPPLQPGVVTVGAIHGGTKHNIIGERVEMQLTVRSDDPETREQLLDGIDRVAKGVALALGAPEDKLPEVIRSKTETTPPTINDAETAARIKAAFLDHFGEDMIFEEPREGMGAEDFAYFVAPETGVKGVYFMVGGTKEKELDAAASHHSPLFRIEPEPSIMSGVEAMVVGAMTLMAKE
ncbi:amidohydrolase [Amphiplicatus metriothermophilus]|uniref:Hippurate hydrolase n=1 Tax=Amphiplicatus metriothermophilus TaxID=1519374 RepID=A0A239PLF6_9PROT|nr:amidohydrolase [Amphiplicatus metriothermophilus]MBB5517502.1 hippurate hydrolase [Amphiplicatus metriothermophilus]SNT68163.1 hippurate hydrolase [Amphiplicatus metriothermophilus]